jgi:DNA-binding response OmpR family regulator/uncharacterized protein (DUF2225 family)
VAAGSHGLSEDPRGSTRLRTPGGFTLRRQSPPSPHRSSIALIDDDEDQRILLRHALELRGYQVLEFPSSESALGWEDGAGQGTSPLAEADLILLDINLPGLSGIETLQLVKETPRLRNIPVAMLTAQRTAETVLQCIRSGAADYFVKPLDFHEVMRRIDRILSDPSDLLSRTASVDLKWSFQEFLIREIKRAERSEDHLAILIGGLRRSRQYTTTLTSDEVDTLWTQNPVEGGNERVAVEVLTHTVGQALRDYDVLVPFGTGEFAAILPSTDRDSIQAVIRKIFSYFPNKLDLPALPRPERWILLIGGACFPFDGRDRLSLFTAAEASLSDEPPPRAPLQESEEPVYSKNVRCTGCGHHFTYARISTRKLKPVTRESDLRMVFEEFDPLFYSVVACTNCGIAGFEQELPALRYLEAPIFGWRYQPRDLHAPFTKPTQTVVPEELSQWLSPPFEAWLERERPSNLSPRLAEELKNRDELVEKSRPSESFHITREMALARHLLARETYRVAGGSPARRARLAHRIAWLHRIGEEKTLEQRFLQEALGFYLTAFHFEDQSDAHPTEIEVFYLLGELSFRLGRDAYAVAIFERLLRDPRLEGNEAFLRMIRRRWYEARHEEPDEL